jgi:valyl-tRNA synthetase
VTEEIWAALPGERDLLSRSRLTKIVVEPDPVVETRVETVRDIVGAVRELRNRMNVPPVRRSALWLKAPPATSSWLQNFQDMMARLAPASEVVVGPDVEPQGPASSVTAREVEVFLSFIGLVSPAAERARLERELVRTAGLYHTIYNKLNDPAFLERAPREVIEAERRRLDQLDADRTRLRRNLEVLAGA